MKIKQSLILLVVFFLLPACGMENEILARELDGTSWMLVSYAGISPIEGKVMTAKFEKGEINGSASCNHYFGSYKVKGDLIAIDGLGWTEMACLDPEGIMEQEQTIMRILSAAESISFQDGYLNISSQSGEILTFTPLEE